MNQTDPLQRLDIFYNGVAAGELSQLEDGGYRYIYLPDYIGPPISVTLPVRDEPYFFDQFPAFFDGLLPEGAMLEGLLTNADLARTDYMGQLAHIGEDMVGAVTARRGRA